jgi:hypothetical protein
MDAGKFPKLSSSCLWHFHVAFNVNPWLKMFRDPNNKREQTDESERKTKTKVLESCRYVMHTINSHCVNGTFFMASRKYTTS